MQSGYAGVMSSAVETSGHARCLLYIAARFLRCVPTSVGTSVGMTKRQKGRHQMKRFNGSEIMLLLLAFASPAHRWRFALLNLVQSQGINPFFH